MPRPEFNNKDEFEVWATNRLTPEKYEVYYTNDGLVIALPLKSTRPVVYGLVNLNTKDNAKEFATHLNKTFNVKIQIFLSLKIKIIIKKKKSLIMVFFMKSTYKLLKNVEKMINKGEYQQAFVKISPIIKNHPDDPILWEKLGFIFKQLFNFKLAIKAFQKALELSEGLPVEKQEEIQSKLDNVFLFSDEHIKKRQIGILMRVVVRYLRNLGHGNWF